MPTNVAHEKNVVQQEEVRLDNTVLDGLNTNPFAIPSYYVN